VALCCSITCCVGVFLEVFQHIVAALRQLDTFIVVVGTLQENKQATQGFGVVSSTCAGALHAALRRLSVPLPRHVDNRGQRHVACCDGPA
jgi:hypothetical protein